MTRKLFISVNFSIAFYKHEMCNSLLQRNHKEDEQFKLTKTWISNSYLIRQNFQSCKIGPCHLCMEGNLKLR